MKDKATDQAINTIVLGDCIAGLNGLAEGSVDLVFADPPFNIGYDYDVYRDELESNEYLAWSREWISAVYRALKPTGTFWLAIGDEYAAELKIESQRIGFIPRSWVIWYYTFGVNCKYKFTRSHAHLHYFVKDRRKFTFNAADLENRVPSARQLVYNDSRGNPDGRLPDDTWILRPQDIADEFRGQRETRGIFRASPARSSSGKASTAARCRSNCSAASFASAQNRAISWSIRFPEARRRWRSRRSWTGDTSASISRRNT